MKCPVDGETLVRTGRQGVEIDHCPACRGVWLDRGELDKIIGRMPAAVPGRALRQDAVHDKPQYEHKPYRRKKESFLSQLFDF
ncbi:MAG: zf-TFIIB domain-containing protein [Bacteroidota bacterium]|nr:zf-TFIIB domain-containing protein [Kiloniellaceae bacterium]